MLAGLKTLKQMGYGVGAGGGDTTIKRGASAPANILEVVQSGKNIIVLYTLVIADE